MRHPDFRPSIAEKDMTPGHEARSQYDARHAAGAQGFHPGFTPRIVGVCGYKCLNPQTRPLTPMNIEFIGSKRIKM
jgi:hypothetical protein